MSDGLRENADPGRELVLVYGTLRRGGAQHWRMDGAEFVTAGTVRGRMYRFDWYPGLVADENAGEIVGEVYAVGPAQLAALDAFEGLSAGEIEGSEYRRVRVSVSGGNGPVMAWIWEWLGPVDEADRMPGGDWLGVPESESRFSVPDAARFDRARQLLSNLDSEA